MEDAAERSFVPDDDEARQSENDSGEGLDEDDEIEPTQGMISRLSLSKSERLKLKLRRLRAKKAEHARAGEELDKDIRVVERLLLDAICEDG